MNKNKYLVKEFTVEVQGKDIEVCQIVADSYGNPRFVVHFSDLGIELKDYDNINRLYGLKRYTAKWYGGGVVFQSYNIEETLKRALEDVQAREQERSSVVPTLRKRYSFLMPH